MSAQLLSRSEGQTLVLTIDNPEMRNALGPDIYSAGIEALNTADSSPDVKSVVITGSGAQFCAGGNLLRLQENRHKPPQVQADSIEQLHGFIDAIRTCAKPVVAAVEGAAAGAGFSLVLACDLIVAASNAVFAMAYSSVGLSPDGGGSWHLGRLLPRQLASELLLLGERTTAQRLQQLGIVNQVSEPGLALADALRLGERLNQRASNASRAIKDLLADAGQRSLSEQLAAERHHFVANLHHANAGEGIAAFLAKRPPRFA